MVCQLPKFFNNVINTVVEPGVGIASHVHHCFKPVGNIRYNKVVIWIIKYLLTSITRVAKSKSVLKQLLKGERIAASAIRLQLR